MNQKCLIHCKFGINAYLFICVDSNTIKIILFYSKYVKFDNKLFGKFSIKLVLQVYTIVKIIKRDLVLSRKYGH